MKKVDVFWIPLLSCLAGMIFLGSEEKRFFIIYLSAGLAFVALGLGIWLFQWKNKVLWLFGALFFFFFGAAVSINSSGFFENEIGLHEPGAISLSGYLVDIQSGEADGKGYLRGRLVVKEKEVNSQKSAAVGEVSFWLSPLSREEQMLWRDGSGVTIQGNLRIREQYRNPGPWLVWQEKSGRGIFRTLRVSGAEAICWEPNWEQKGVGWAFEIRTFFVSQMEKRMPARDANLLRGVLFGGREGISPEWRELFVATGLTHILSVSGTHLAVLFGGLLWLGALFRLKSKYIAGISVLVLLLYSFLCGFPPPVVRSFWMALGLALAYGAERDRSNQRIFAMTVLGMIIWEPRWIYDVSFQLSVAATLGLVIALPYLKEEKTVWNFWRGPLIFTISAQLMSLTFMAAYFQEMSLVAPMSNLVLLFFFEAALIFGLLGSVLYFVWEGFGQIFWVLASLSLGAGLEGMRLLAKIPWVLLPLPAMSLWSGMVYYIGVFILFGAFVLKNRKGIVLGILGSLLLGCLFYRLWWIEPSGTLEIHMIDVGQGDGILIRTPKGQSILVDTGGIPGVQTDFNIGERVVAPYLWQIGVREIDLLIISHGDEDHAGGAKAVMERFAVGEMWAPLGALSRFEGIEKKIVTPSVGHEIILDEVKFKILAQPPEKEKSWSQIIEVSYGNHTFLFTGDMESKEEKAFLEQAEFGEITGLKVGHHGARNGSSAELLQKLKPQISLISVGEANRFGHPTIQTLGRLKAVGSEVYRTDLQGRIILYSDGEKYWVETTNR
jgi:DNA internalization-related competence protein ComEC/Rec2